MPAVWLPYHAFSVEALSASFFVDVTLVLSIAGGCKKKLKFNENDGATKILNNIYIYHFTFILPTNQIVIYSSIYTSSAEIQTIHFYLVCRLVETFSNPRQNIYNSLTRAIYFSAMSLPPFPI